MEEEEENSEILNGSKFAKSVTYDHNCIIY